MRRIALALEALSAVLLIALMAVTGVDVVGRYLFDAPLPGAFETTELLLGAFVFAALPLVSREGGHVEVDLFAAFLPGRALRALGWFAAAAAAGTLGFFAWRLTVLGLHQWADGARSISLQIPFAPFAIFGAVACLLAAVYGLLRAWRA